mgnify:CR=1 FL=1
MLSIKYIGCKTSSSAQKRKAGHSPPPTSGGGKGEGEKERESDERRRGMYAVACSAAAPARQPDATADNGDGRVVKETCTATERYRGGEREGEKERKRG